MDTQQYIKATLCHHDMLLNCETKIDPLYQHQLYWNYQYKRCFVKIETFGVLLGNATIDGDGNENFLNALIVGKP